MKIEIEIPGFVPPERIIFIMAGIEKIGYIMPHTRKVYVKVSQCSRCGRCCARIDCPDLKKEVGNTNKFKCDLGAKRPYLCSISDPGTIPECTSRYEEMK